MPSSESAAVVDIFAGSLPTSGSVSAKPEMAPLASLGSHFFFWSSVPNRRSGCGTPIDWCAEIQTAVDAQWLATIATARL